MTHPVRSIVGIGLIALVTLAARFSALPFAGEDRLTPDGARFLNLARSVERGLGYVTPEAWPAWLNPARLPTHETFKEPGYPYALAALTPLTRDPFRAGQWLSLWAGLLLPFAVWGLVRALDDDVRVAELAGLLAAASPVLIRQSVYVMAESLFALLVTTAFALAAMRPRIGVQAWGVAAGAGLALGLAWLVRAQAMLALPAVLGLLALHRRERPDWAKPTVALLTCALALSPWLARNLRLFGDPFHSDVAPFALWPYVDTFAFSHGLELPPSPFGFVVAHPGEVLRHTFSSLRHFGWHTLPHDLLGSRIWLVPLAIGAVVAVGRMRTWWPLLLFAGATAVFLLPLNWVARYFAATAPVVCALTAVGTAWLLRGEDSRPMLGRFTTTHLTAAGIAVLLTLGCVAAVRSTGDTYRPEWDAARAWGPRLQQRLAPGEAVMADLTSYWAWASDRPAVHPVVADEQRLREIARRLRVRCAVFTSEFEQEYASRLPGGRLPVWFVLADSDSATGTRLYEISPD